ncbi:MAG: LuxR C-terminal-related transcriptional regulator, partial [Caldilineaceae bacterium]
LHAEYYLAVAETADAQLLGNQAVPLRRLIAEQENLRAALAWSLRASSSDPHSGALALRLVGVLWNYWLMHGDWSEGRRWIERALAGAGARAEMREARLNALLGGGALALLQADYAPARAHLQECVALATAWGAGRVVVDAAVGLGLIAIELHELAQAKTWLEQALAQARQDGYTLGIGGALLHLGSVQCELRAYAQAQALYAAGLAQYEELQAEWDIADALHYLAQASRLLGDSARAAALFAESLTRWRRLGITQWGWIGACLSGVAALFSTGRQVEAARLFGAAAALQARIGVPAPALVRSDVRAELAAVRTGLGEDAFAQAWAAGQVLAPEQAIDLAITLATSLPPAPALARSSLPTSPDGLTAREVEVLQLLAEGLTYAEIAARLVIARRTVNAHVSSIYAKLGVTSRAAATRYALSNNLLG